MEAPAGASSGEDAFLVSKRVPFEDPHMTNGGRWLPQSFVKRHRFYPGGKGPHDNIFVKVAPLSLYWKLAFSMLVMGSTSILQSRAENYV